MRTLSFSVRGQTIAPAPGSDMSGLICGSVGYLAARFSFDEAWDGCKKAASFFDAKEREYAAPIIAGECKIPAEALTGRVFYVSVSGAKRGYKIRTNKIIIRQGG